MLQKIKTEIIPQVENALGVKFKDKEIILHALIHRSFLNENKNTGLTSNERYEFLGDAVLELWSSQKLFHQFPDFKEGELTNLRALLVCTQNLAEIAQDIELGNFLLLSKGEEIHGGRTNQSILADGFEAIIGAIYLDQGIDAAYSFLDAQLTQSIKELSGKKDYKDPKSIFQEVAQAKKGITPHYLTIKESGPDHKKIFEVGVYLGDTLIANGTGNSKQKAEENASIKATKILNNPV